MEAGREVGRDELGRLLWPNVSDVQAQHGLRQALYKLRSYGAKITTQRSAVRLSPGSFATDFAELLTSQTPAAQEDLAEQISGTFLPGYRPQLSEAFATWVERQRDVVHSAVARTLMAGMQAKKRVSDWNRAERLATMCLSIDPLNEEATLTVAEAAALGGSKTKALSILNRYLEDIGEDAGEIKLPAVLLRRRISEAYQDNNSPIRDAPLVGREEEMAELTRALAEARGGHGSAYVIAGESGIGKTRLVTEFTRVAALQRVHIVRVICQAHDVKRPLSAFVDLVPKLLTLPGALGCSPESMGYLHRLTALEEDAAGFETYGMSTEGLFAHVQAAVADLVDAVAGECSLIIHIEDAQWLDTYSHALQSTLSKQANSRRLLLLSTVTPVVGSEQKIEWQPQILLNIKPLTREASAALVDASLSKRSATSPSFRDWCIRSGCGNPILIVELCSRALDDGSFSAPASLANLIDARLSTLSALSRRVLQTLCILGRHSNLATIETVLGERRVLLLESLDELQDGGFIDHNAEAISSRHALITAAALRQASSSSRALLHRHAAQTLEDIAKNNSTVLWDCAEHWRQAGEFARAVRLMADCARHSLKMGLPLEAATMLEAAANFADDHAQIELLKDCTTAYRTAGVWSDAGRLAKRTLEAMTRASVTAAALMEAEFVYLYTTTRQSPPTRDTVMKLLGYVASSEVSTSLRLQAGTTLLMQSDDNQNKTLAKNVYLAVLKIEIDSPEEAARLDHFHLIYHSSFGDPRDALAAVERLTTFAVKTSDFALGALYLLHAGHSRRVSGDPADAHDLYRQSYDISRAHYLYYTAEAAAGAIVGLALSAGDLILARQWCDLAKAESTKSGRGMSYPESMSYESELYLREERYEEARVRIHTLREYSSQLGSVRARARQLALEADLKITSGHALSDRECRAMLTILAKTANAFRNDYFVAQLVRGLASMKRKSQASQILSRYLRIDRPSREKLSVDILELRHTLKAGECSIADE
ncbi:MAG: AAA family ATPase [Chthoniobacterales bacterium]|nr:AAA family ATPase [Chthoniobacterales bacterium]